MISKLYILLLVGFLKVLPAVANNHANDLQEAQTQESAQVEPIEFSPTLFDRFQNDTDFDYYAHLEVQEPSHWQQFKNWLSRLWQSLWKTVFGNNYSNNSFLHFMYNALPYIIIAVAVGFIIWMFYKLNPGAALLEDRQPGEVFYTEEEEIIKTRNIQELIDQALAQKNYRLAVRYSYLYVIQKLAEIEFIEYQFDKTNSDYLNELKNTPVENGFKTITNLYDYTWYGNFEVSENDYFQSRPVFNDLEKIIAPKP